MYVIKPYEKKGQMMIVSKSTIPGLVGYLNRQVRLQFGIRSVEVTIHFSDAIKKENVYLSTDVLKQLRLPLTCGYDLVVQGGKVTIGPFIGILCELTNRKLTEMLPTYSSFVKGYRYIGGAIAVFSIEGIQKEKQTITGYLYDPEKNSWEVKSLPFPAVVMSIAEPSLTASWEVFHEHMKNFESLLGGRVFNYPHFSKWEMHQMLRSELKEHLPETTLYTNVENIHEMLNRHGNIYIKPLHGRLGKRIFNVVKNGEQIKVKYDEKRMRHEEVFSSNADSHLFFQKHLIPGAFLIQQTIPLKMHKGSVIDFRVMVAKNEKGLWENLGIYSRYGARGQIVSNITAGGHTEIARDTLKTVWKLEDKEIQRVEQEMEQIVLRSIEVLENQGYHLGNIGVDIGLDEECHMSIIEINHQNPDPYIALMANDRLAFYKCRFQLMRYGRYLGGF
ncbi:YheC/YheD family protein [Guptibacillus sedimenti]|uniref:YheC/YheD family endospore coat-associated protein n=1 Tax=Guptibacillus sedimenti TaxID=3025680 RepID=UPI002362A1F1|nr:YheC/YheD family protein [Pseudalkalibacillus sedimenti]